MFLFFNGKLFSQIINFSQIYAIKYFYNPGFAAKDYCTNIIVHTSEQAPSFQGGFKTVNLSFSKFYPKYKSGFSIYFQNDISPLQILYHQNFSLSYIFASKLGKINFALWSQVNLFDYTINSKSIILPSSLNYITGEIIKPTITYANNFDASVYTSFGTLIFNKYFFAGISYHNAANIWTLKKYKLEPQFSAISGLKLKNLEFYIFSNNLTINQLGTLYHTNKIFFGINLALDELKFVSIGWDFGLKLNNYIISFGYSTKNFNFSLYELSIIFRLKCKNSRFHTIICPAYQL